jgi:hypothetical protein
MIEIQIGTRTFKAPTTWAECPRSQAERLAYFIGRKVFNEANIVSVPTDNTNTAAIVSVPTDNIHLTRQQQEELITEWLRIPTKFWEKLTMQPHEFHYLLEKAAWICDPATPMQLSFESIAHNGKKYFLPEYNYKSATALEIAWANVSWLNFTQATPTAAVVPTVVSVPTDNHLNIAAASVPTDNHLNELLSIILRPIRPDIDHCQTDPNWNGDKRIPLANHICEQIEIEIATLPEATKLLALRYFEAMNVAFVQEFDVLFGAANTEGVGIAPAYPEGFGWEAALRRIAKEGTFGTYEKVCQTNGRQIWLYEYQKYLEIQAEIATQKLNETKK